MSNNLRWKIFFFFLAAGNLLNGVWMLFAPNNWYANFPGRVSDFGPMNEHFVRDLGCVFVLFAILSLKGAFQSSWRKNALLILLLWYVPHAVVHLFDTFRGLVSMEHLYMDLPLVYVPAALFGIMLYVLHRETKGQEGAR